MAHAMNRTEYRSALRADHGTPRRFLAYCRCRLCDTPGNRRFATMLRNTHGTMHDPASDETATG